MEPVSLERESPLSEEARAGYSKRLRFPNPKNVSSSFLLERPHPTQDRGRGKDYFRRNSKTRKSPDPQGSSWIGALDSCLDSVLAIVLASKL